MIFKISSIKFSNFMSESSGMFLKHVRSLVPEVLTQCHWGQMNTCFADKIPGDNDVANPGTYTLRTTASA